MKVTTYKRDLRKLLNAASSEYINMTSLDQSLFQDCALHSYTVVEPIIASDMELLRVFKSRVKLYID